MEVGETSINEMKNNNKRMCLSALRVTGNCIKCRYYDNCESRIIDIDKDRKRTIILNNKARLKAEMLQADEDLKVLLSGGTETIKNLDFKELKGGNNKNGVKN